jgi:signal transduction histidine kinase
MDIAQKLRRAINTCMPNSQVIPVIRLALGAATLLLVMAERWNAGHSFSPAEGLLIAYLAYGIILSWLTRIHSPFFSALEGWEHWIDASVYVLLVMLHGEKGAYLICPLLLAIFVASCRRGPTPALAVTTASSVFIVAWLLFSKLRSGYFDIDLSLIAPLALLMLGSLIVYLGGSDILLKRRLQFITEITKIANPRLGADSMIRSFIAQLRAFYDADECILIMADLGETQILMRRVNRLHPQGGGKAVQLPQDLVWRFLDLPMDIAVVRQSGPQMTIWPKANYIEYNVIECKPSDQARNQYEKLSAILDSPCFLSVPVRYHNETIGRIFLTSARACFEEPDIQFLLQVCEHFMPLVDNTRLVDRMAKDASMAERKKIARDLHDTVLQPYIGLKLGIGSLRQKLDGQSLQMMDIDRLLEVNEHAIEDMRRYVSALKGNTEQDGDLLLSIQRFVEKFTFATGISVEIDAGNLSRVEGRLAAEAFQIISEGLSNVRRHTESMKAKIYIRLLDDKLDLRIENPGGNRVAYQPFKPRSIAERAEALGGKATVEPILHGGSRVLVLVPL